MLLEQAFVRGYGYQAVSLGRDCDPVLISRFEYRIFDDPNLVGWFSSRWDVFLRAG